MVKADDKVQYEGSDDEKYSHFEELQQRVKQLQDIVNEHAEILRQNNLIKTEKTQAPYFDEDTVFKKLEGD